MNIKQQVQAMWDRLANYHWSPKHPSEYVLRTEDKVRGIGLIAQNNYGAFNLAWASVEGRCGDLAEHTEIITRFSRYQTVTTHMLNDVPLSDWLCFLRPNGFRMLIQSTETIPVPLKQELLYVTGKAINMERVTP